MMMNTHLCGYYGMQNSGDDALLFATAWGAKKYRKASTISVSTPRQLSVPGFGVVAAPLKQTQRFRGENRLRHYGAALRSHSIIFGGGSVLHNSHDIGIKRHLVKLSGHQALALGVGIGPFRDVGAEKSCALFLQECEFVGVRDKNSFDIAKTLAPNANIELTFDLAPLLRLHEQFKREGFGDKPRKGVCVCLCPKERLVGNTHIEAERLAELAYALMKIHSETGRQITLLDFNGNSGLLGDKPVHQELLALIPEGVVKEHLHYHHDPLTVVNKLAGFELVIGMRLHASIMSYLVETPVVSLNYHSKCVGWCEQVGLASSLQFETDALDAESLSHAVVSGLQNGFPATQLSINDALARSLKNWRVSL